MADAVNNKQLTEHSEYHKPSVHHVAGQIGAAHLYIGELPSPRVLYKNKVYANTAFSSRGC